MSKYIEAVEPLMGAYITVTSTGSVVVDWGAPYPDYLSDE
jgi:hypothetical protein